MAPPDTTDYARPFRDARWFDIVPRHVACPQLERRCLLHAGPPLRGPAPAPMVNAAVQALLFDGLAADVGSARALLAGGGVRLAPAQDHGVVTPLAQVVSASMPLAAVRAGAWVRYAPLVEGPAPALRFGSAAPDTLARLRALNAWAGATLGPRVRAAPLAIDALVRAATAAGDDCHARTTAANDALLAELDGLDAPHAAELRASPGFVLPILMAAAAAALRRHDSRIEAIGGNGVDFGVRHRGAAAWRQAPATTPRGPRLAGRDAVVGLGAIGDSAVLDFCGLGGQAFGAAPLLAAEWAAVLPHDAIERRSRLIDPDTGLIDPARVAAGVVGPLINLAILGAGGGDGLIGRGVYCPPPSLFEAIGP